LQYYLKNGLLKKSVFYAEKLQVLQEKAGHIQQLCSTLNILGKLYTTLPEMDKAIERLNKALSLSRQAGDRKMESYSLTNLGLLLRKMDNLDESLESYFLAKEIMEELILSREDTADKRFQSNYLQVLDQIGVLYNILKQSDKALQYMKLSLEKAREANILPSIYSALINLGVYYSDKDSDKSLSCYLQAIPYVEKDNNRQILAVVMSNIGSVYEDKEAYMKALGYYFQALDVTDSLEHGDYELFFTKNIGSVYCKLGEYDKSLEYVERSLALAKKDNHTSEIEENYQLLSKIYRAMKNFPMALDFSDKYIALKEESLSKEMQQRVQVLQDKYEKTKEELIVIRKKSSLLSEVLQKKMKLDFIGRSPGIKKVNKMAMQAAAATNANILITGESGTGKEIIAKVIHFASTRHDNMFIAVNSGSIPDNLMESAFWGHKEGAFTGAIADQTGYLLMADKGTLFLDEIGDMPMSLQTKLLRVLENKKFLPVGGKEEIESDFRLITATNKNIEKLIAENIFRVDLFYRINTIEIRIPPLRERKEDILPLTQHYLSHFAHSMNKPVPRLGKDVADFLEQYPFPGNVRELKNMMERVMITQKRDTIYAEDFCSRLKQNLVQKEENLPVTTLAEMEESMIKKTLQQTGFNISKTARLLGIHYTTLNRKLKSLNLNKEYS
jgi:transcriptional regulator with PAS, ATPase and Fis domain